MKDHFTFLRILLLASTLLFAIPGLFAQVFPVDLSLNIMRPHSPAFHTLGNPSGFGHQVNQVQLFLTLKDSRESMLNVGLQWEIITERGKFTANPELALIPINLVFGIPTSLSNLQLSTYFSEVSFPPAMLNNGFLPQGACEICATAIELTNRSPVSLKVCAFLFLEELDPPVILLPLDSIIPYFPQNVQLSWQPLHAASFPIEYTLEIWEMIPPLTPEQIITSTPPLFVKTIQQITTAFIGPSDPPLMVGSHYLAQVTARDIVNMGGSAPVYLFKNFGRSPVHIFKYGYTMDDIPCEQPTGLGYDTSEDLETYIFWDGGAIPSTGVQGQGIEVGSSESQGNNSGFRSFYNLNWREKNASDPSGSWSNYTTDLAYYNFDAFKRGRTYQVFVEKACPSDMISSDTIEISFSQLPPERPYSCGQAPLDLRLDNQIPLQKLLINDTIMAGDSRVIITEAMGSNGIFSGEGYFKAPFIKSVKLAVVFDNIRINDEYRLIQGDIITKWDPTGSNIIDGDGLEDLLNQDEFEVPEVFITDVDSVGIDENGNVIVYHGGGTTTFSQPIIVNSNTGSYTVSGGYVMPMLEDFLIPDDLMPGVRLKFTAHENSTFGFDPYDDRIPDQYQSQEDYKIPYKSIGRGLADSLVGILEGEWDINKIMLVSSRGAVLPIVVTGSNSLLIRTAGVDDNEIIYAIADNGSGLGLFIQKSYQYTNYHVHLVRVNNAGNSIDAAELENSMNKILHQGVTLSTVNFHPIELSDADPDNVIGAQSKLITAYSSDMNRIIRNFVNQAGSDLEENHFYIFLVDNLQGDVAGFMPQGMQFGFIDVAKVSGNALSKVLTHELGHGAFTLRHYWDDYVGGTDVDHGNLMDYGPGGTRLLVRQWERMHQQRFPLPWLDGDGDGQFGNLMWLTNCITSNYGWLPFSFAGSKSTCPVGPNEVDLGCVPGIKLGNNSCYLASVDHTGFYHNSDSLPISLYPNLADDAIVHLYKDNGICGTNTYYSTSWGYIKGKKGNFSFEMNDSITFEGTIPCGVDQNAPGALIKPLFTVIPEEHINATPEAFDSMINVLGNKLRDAHLYAKANLHQYPFDPDQEAFHHIIDYTRFSEKFEGDDKLLLLEHRLAYLMKETGVGFYVLYEPSNFTFNPESFNLIANRAIQESGITEPIVAVTIPYTFRSAYEGGPDVGYIMPGYSSNYGETFEGLTSNLESKELYKVLAGLYTTLEKPYRNYIGYLRYDGNITFRKINHGTGRGKDRINEMVLYYDQANINQISVAYANVLTICAQEQSNFNACKQALNSYIAQLEYIRQESSRDYSIYEFEDRLIEYYYDDQTGLNNPDDIYASRFAQFEYGKLGSILPDYLLNLFGNALPQSNALYDTDTYQFWYDLADIVSIVSSPFQLDFIAEAAGLIAAQYDDQTERRILNTSAYSMGMATSGVPAITFKSISAGVGFVWLVARREAITRFAASHEVIDFFAERFQLQISRDLAEKVVRSELLSAQLVKNDFLVKQIGESTKATELLDDLATNPAFLQAIDQNPFLVEAWELLIMRPKIRVDPESILRISEMMNDINFINRLPGGMSQFKNIADKLVHPCCGVTHEFMKPLLDHLDDIQYTVNTFYNRPGFNQLVEALSHSLFTVQDGTSHVLTYLRNLDPVTVKRFEANIVDAVSDADNLDGICVNCLFDIEIQLPNGAIRKLELKSYKAETLEHISSNQQFKNQFKAYLATAIDMNGFQYIFNRRKGVNINMVKAKFKELFQYDNYSIYHQIGGVENEALQSIGITSLELFVVKVNNLDPLLFKFINVP